MYLITYFDRVNLSAATPQIMKEFHFSKITMGVILSAFSWMYALGQVPGGWLGDRFGARRVLPTIVTFWSLMTAVTAYAGSYVGFLVCRGLFGVGEAGAFPTATRGMQLWFTREERGLVQGVTHSASRLGAAIGTPLAIYIMAAFGWRIMFVAFGAVGVVWAVFFWFFYRNQPEEHKGVNRAELAQIRGTDANGNINPPPNSGKKPAVPWRALVTSPNMWAIMVAYFMYNYVLWIFLSWLPSYLVTYRHFDLIKVGIFASLPLLLGVIGDSFGGWLTDFLTSKTGSAKLGRRAVAIGGFIGAICFIIPAAVTADPYVAVYCLAGTMFFLECTIGPVWAVTMDVGGQYSGTVTGMMNMGGNIGGAVSPLVFGVLVQLGSWTLPFIVAAGLMIVGIFIWAFWLNPEKQVLPDPGVSVEAA